MVPRVPAPPEKAIHDYNGTGSWSAEQILTRYKGYCRSLHVSRPIRRGLFGALIQGESYR